MRGSPEDKVRKRPGPNWELGALKRQGQHFGNATLSAPGPSFPHEHSARDPKDPTVIRLGNAIELNPDDDQIRNGKQQKEYWHSFIAVQPMHMLIGNAELSWGAPRDRMTTALPSHTPMQHRDPRALIREARQK